MKQKYWHEKWQTNDIGFHESTVSPDLVTYLPKLNLSAGNCIFVPLCGKSKDLLWLSAQGFRVIGVELSPIACDEFFTELNVIPRITRRASFIHYAHDNIELFCGDIFDLTAADFPPIHAMYDCKALIALSADTRRKYVNHLIQCLGTQIKILLLTRTTNCNVTPPPYSVDEAEINSLYRHSFKNIQHLKCAAAQDIPERLIKKGYTEMAESVYVISSVRI